MLCTFDKDTVEYRVRSCWLFWEICTLQLSHKTFWQPLLSRSTYPCSVITCSFITEPCGDGRVWKTLYYQCYGLWKPELIHFRAKQWQLVDLLGLLCEHKQSLVWMSWRFFVCSSTGIIYCFCLLFKPVDVDELITPRRGRRKGEKWYFLYLSKLLWTTHFTKLGQKMGLIGL